MAKRVSNYQESANKQELNDRVISFLSLIVFNRKRALLHPRRFEIKSRYFRNFSLHHDLILIALESSYAFDKGRVWTHTHAQIRSFESMPSGISFECISLFARDSKYRGKAA